MGLTSRTDDPDRVAGAPGMAARKRAAVELVHSHDTVLRATARRYSICADDADDAFQRGIEILLSKAPTTEVRQLVPWTRTVIKHEALAVRRTRERMLGKPPSPIDPENEQDWVQLIPSTGTGPDERAISREKVARSREALGQLKPAELRALTLLAEGYSYAEIGAMNDWTHTKVNRCLAEGRRRFRSVFSESEAGERCHRFEPMISTGCDGELDQAGLEELEDHLAGCGHCRATLKAYRAAPRAAAALAPVIATPQTLWDRVHELAVSIQTKLQGLGVADVPGPGALAAGGTRGAGAALVAKAVAVCAGTAGTAAICVAAGVMPTPMIAPQGDRTVPSDRAVRVQGPDRPVEVPVEDVRPGPSPPAVEPSGHRQPDPAEPAQETKKPDPPPPPPPTPTESEFTPEAAGTPVTAAASPPVPDRAGSGGRSGSSGSIPVGGGGGEFGP